MKNLQTCTDEEFSKELEVRINRVFNIKNRTRSVLFQTLKRTLTGFNYWKNQPRGIYKNAHQ